MKRHFALIVFLISGLAWANEPYVPPAREISLPEEVRLKALDLLFTDDRGLIWLAAGSDLFWYDGSDFQPIDATAEMDTDVIRSFYHDHRGNYWVGWESGAISTLRGDSLKPYLPEEGTPSVPVIAWTEDGDGRLWLATDGEGAYVRDLTGRWYQFGLDDGLPSLYTYAIAGTDSAVFLATDQGLAVVSFSAGEKEVRVLGPREGLPDQIVKVLAPAQGRMLLGYYYDAISSFTENAQLLANYKAPGENVHQLISSGNVIWWLGESGNLYFRVKGGEWRKVQLEEDRRLKVRHIAADHEGHLWAATEDGLFQLNVWYEFLPTDLAVSALCYAEGTVWFALGSDLWSYLPGTGVRSKIWSGDYPIISLFAGKDDRIWMGTFDNGVQILDPSTLDYYNLTEREGLLNNNVLSIDGSEDGVWLGTLAGLSFVHYDDSYQYPMLENFQTYGGKKLQYIYQVYVGTDQEVLLATDGDGVIRWKEDQDPEVIASQVVLDVTGDKEGRIWWINTEGQLYCWAPDHELKEIPAADKEIGEVSGLKVLEDGDILVIHENGVYRWSVTSMSWNYYDRSFGLGILRPELHAHAIGDGEDLFIGSTSGLHVLRMNLMPEANEPVTMLRGTELFHIPTERHEFKYDENYITFKYIGKWYTDPDEVRYKVRLQNYDMDWRITRNADVTYSKLPPGDYRFEVMAGIDNQFSEGQVKTYTFRISPPWYTRWYVSFLAITMLILLIYWIVRMRIQRLTFRDKLEKEKVRAQYESIKSQVNPHFLFNSFNTLMALIEEDPKDASSYLQDLSDFFRHILQFREVDLITVEEELRIISVYLQLQAKRFGEGMQVDIDVPRNIQETLVPPLTFQLLVENAFKHNVASRKFPLEIRIYAEAGSLVIWNRRREKKKKEESTGYGLFGIQKKYAYYTNTEVRIDQSDDHFAVYLPIIKSSSQ